MCFWSFSPSKHSQRFSRTVWSCIPAPTSAAAGTCWILSLSLWGMCEVTWNNTSKFKSSYIYLYSAFHNTHCFKADLQKIMTFMFMISSCPVVGFSRLGRDNNIAVEICYILYIALCEFTVYIWVKLDILINATLYKGFHLFRIFYLIGLIKTELKATWCT